MKVTVEKYKGDTDSTLMVFDLSGNNKRYESSVKEGYTYYVFRTQEKAWVQHSKQLTNEEKQWVIKHESK
jgi:hypothetical protein